MSNLVIDSHSVRRDGDMWCITDLWKAAGSPHNHRPADWMKLPTTMALAEFLNDSLEVGKSHLECFRVVRGGRDSGSTWAHWQLALAYAKYLSPAFHVRVNEIYKAFTSGHLVPLPVLTGVPTRGQLMDAALTRFEESGEPLFSSAPGYFSILQLIFERKLFYAFLEYGVDLSQWAVDISVGRTFSQFYEERLQEKYGRCYESFEEMACIRYPDTWKQRSAGSIAVKAYPNAAKAETAEWFYATYLTKKSTVKYLEERKSTPALTEGAKPAPAPAPALGPVRPGPAKALERVPSQAPPRTSKAKRMAGCFPRRGRPKSAGSRFD